MSKSIFDIAFGDLCVEIRKLDETLIPQVTVSMVSKKTGTVQDICMVGPDRDDEGNPLPTDTLQCLVWGDAHQESYTDEFIINPCQDFDESDDDEDDQLEAIFTPEDGYCLNYVPCNGGIMVENSLEFGPGDYTGKIGHNVVVANRNQLAFIDKKGQIQYKEDVPFVVKRAVELYAKTKRGRK